MAEPGFKARLPNGWIILLLLAKNVEHWYVSPSEWHLLGTKQEQHRKLRVLWIFLLPICIPPSLLSCPFTLFGLKFWNANVQTQNTSRGLLHLRSWCQGWSPSPQVRDLWLHRLVIWRVTPFGPGMAQSLGEEGDSPMESYKCRRGRNICWEAVRHFSGLLKIETCVKGKSDERAYSLHCLRVSSWDKVF